MRQQRCSRLILLAGWLLLLTVSLAWGHADLDPRQSLPNKWETYTLNVPTETEMPTIAVRLQVPPEFEVEMVGHTQVWQMTKTRDERGYVRDITWSGSQIPPQTFSEFKLLVRNPTAPGLYVWKIEQVYEDNSTALWEAQTQIMAADNTLAQRAEEAWRSAQIATTVSLVAIGIATTLIIIVVIGMVQTGRARPGGEGL
jgi:uncharacterized protein YcnI